MLPARICDSPATSSAEMTDSPSSVLVLQAHHQFGAQDVELAVQDATAPGDVALLGFEFGDERAQVVVRAGHQIDDVIHGATPLRA